MLKDGDIVNVDVTTLFGGFHGDTSATFYIGTRERGRAQGSAPKRFVARRWSSESPK